MDSGIFCELVVVKLYFFSVFDSQKMAEHGGINKNDVFELPFFSLNVHFFVLSFFLTASDYFVRFSLKSSSSLFKTWST